MALEYKFTIPASDSERSDIDRFMESAQTMLKNNWQDTRLEKPNR